MTMAFSIKTAFCIFAFTASIIDARQIPANLQSFYNQAKVCGIISSLPNAYELTLFDKNMGASCPRVLKSGFQDGDGNCMSSIEQMFFWMRVLISFQRASPIVPRDVMTASLILSTSPDLSLPWMAWMLTAMVQTTLLEGVITILRAKTRLLSRTLSSHSGSQILTPTFTAMLSSGTTAIPQPLTPVLQGCNH